MKRLTTVGLCCLLITGCGEPLVAPSAAAPNLDALDELTGDAPTLEGVEEEDLTACPRPLEPAPDEAALGPQPHEFVVSCGTCTFSVNTVALRYALTAKDDPGFIQPDTRLHMRLASSQDPAGFSASFDAPPTGTMRFKTATLNPHLVAAGTRMTLSVCIGGASHSVDFLANP